MKRIALAAILSLIVSASASAFDLNPGPRGPGKISEEWSYASVNSAIVYWQTENPATSWVEYGTTNACGLRTPASGLPPREFFKGLLDNPYHTQFHRLTGLEPGTTYHWRSVSVGTDGKEIRGEDRTIETKKPDGMIRIPDDLAGGPPYKLDKPGVYLLTKDLADDGTALEITAPGNVTLDLNGHTVVYGNAAGAAYGINTGVWNKPGLKLLNGILRQGKALDKLCHPVLARSTRGIEIAGLDMTYGGADCHGIHCYESKDGVAHHNVVYDTGTHITNRHQGLDAIHGMKAMDHNLVARARHRGLDGGDEVAFNEVYLDSWATNAFGIRCGVFVHDNRVFGTGYMPEAIGAPWGDSTEPRRIWNNSIELVAQKIAGRSKEYGDSSNLSGLRVTPYNFRHENFDFRGNTVYVHGQHATKMRGIWVSPTIKTKNILFRDNTIVVIADETCNADLCQCVSVTGEPDDAQEGVVFEGNTFITNICNVRFAESYGTANNTRFLGNTFVRVGERKDYHTIRCGWWVSDTFGHVFRDSIFEGGAGYDKITFEGGLTQLTGKDAEGEYAKMKARRDFAVEWTLTVKTAPGTKVTVKDATGREAFSGAADAEGKVDVPLAQYKLEGAGEFNKGGSKRTDFTPHAIAVEAGGKTATKQVTMDRKQTLEIRP